MGSLRNRNSCQWLCQDDRRITTFVSADAISDIFLESLNLSNITIEIGDIDTDSINTNIINANIGNIINLTSTTTLTSTLNATSSISTLLLDATTINGFTVPIGEDVVFIGSTASKFFKWDSSEDTLTISGDLLVSGSVILTNTEKLVTDDPIIRIGGEDPPTSSQMTDYGLEFFYFDTDTSVAKQAFSGWDDSAKKFIFADNVFATVGVSGLPYETIGVTDYADILVDSVCANIIAPQSTSTSLGITSANDIDVFSEGDITFDSSSLLFSTDGASGIDIITSNGDIDISITGSTDLTLKHNNVNVLQIDSSDGILSDVKKTDYRVWLPYSKFDSINGIWLTQRELLSGNPTYFWEKEERAETAYVISDINQSVRSTTSKGFQLTEIFVAYKIETESIISIAPIITQKTFDSTLPSAGIAVSNIPFTDVNLSAGIAVGDHFRSVTIDTPFFINNESIISVELGITTPSNSSFKFYGMYLNFDQQHF